VREREGKRGGGNDEELEMQNLKAIILSKAVLQMRQRCHCMARLSVLTECGGKRTPLNEWWLTYSESEEGREN
jgi:hypothetical protein